MENLEILNPKPDEKEIKNDNNLLKNAFKKNQEIRDKAIKDFYKTNQQAEVGPKPLTMEDLKDKISQKEIDEHRKYYQEHPNMYRTDK